MYLQENNLSKASFFGHSMGGYVGLYLALHYPQLIEKLVTPGTKLHWDQQTAEQAKGALDPELIEQKVPKFAKLLQERHQPAAWKKLLHKTAELLQSI